MLRISCPNEQFFNSIVADGTAHDHFGLHRTPNDTRAATLDNAVKELLRQAYNSGARVQSSHKLLDLGSGTGGSAHRLASLIDASITCVDIDTNACKRNDAAVKSMELDSKVQIVNSDFKSLPSEWTKKFDVVWSMDSLAASDDKPGVIEQAARVLKPGGILVFTDILRSPGADHADVQKYTGANSLHKLYAMHEYETECKKADFTVLRTFHFGAHVTQTYRKVLADAKEKRSHIIGDECNEDQFDVCVGRLEKELKMIVSGDSFTWGGIVAVKNDPEERDGKLVIGG